MKKEDQPMKESPQETLKIPDEWNDWEGNFDELVVASDAVLKQIAPDVHPPSGSIVRYYQQQGVVGRGETRGRTKRFGADELAQVVGAKWLAQQNIPLSLARSAASNSEKSEVVRSHPAQTLVSQLMQNAGLLTQSTPKNPDTGILRAFPATTVSGCILGLSGASTPVLNEATPKSRGSTSDYVSIPTGGIVRYSLNAGAVVELNTTGDIQAQATAIQTFVNQLVSAPHKLSPAPKKD